MPGPTLRRPPGQGSGKQYQLAARMACLDSEVRLGRIFQGEFPAHVNPQLPAVNEASAFTEDFAVVRDSAWVDLAVEATVTHRVRMRFTDGLQPKYRIVCEGRTFDIISVVERGRRVEHELLVTEVIDG